MNKFKFLTGDINWQTYGGKWYKQVVSSTYHIIELINMWNATGEEDQDKYVVELREIDLSHLSEKQIKESVESCGWINEENINTLMVIESIHSYGYGAPMGNWSGNNYSKLLKLARDESNQLSDDDYHENQMNRPVNKLGSTAREYAQGDTISAMIRGIANNNMDAKILGKIHGLKSEDIQEIQSDESLKNFNLYR